MNADVPRWARVRPVATSADPDRSATDRSRAQTARGDDDYGDIEPADPDAPPRHPRTRELIFTFCSNAPYGDLRRECAVTHTGYSALKAHAGAGNTTVWADWTTGVRVSEARCDHHLFWPPPDRGEALADCLLYAFKHGDVDELARIRAAMAPGDAELVIDAIRDEQARRLLSETEIFMSLECER